MNRILISTTLALAAAPFAVYGQDSTDNLNRFSIGPTFGLNFRADFHLRAIANPSNPGPATGGANHTYDDGYVLVDSSGNAGGLTRNWGYQNAAQVVGNSMEFHALQPVGSPSSSEDPQYGAELVYQRVLGHLVFIPGIWGLESGFGFTQIDLRQNVLGTGITDAYSLNGVVPPGAGYNGNYSGPGALLGDTPTRTTVPLAGFQKLSGQMYGIRLGPFAEWQLTDNLSIAASVGLTLAPTTLDYDFLESESSAGSTYSVSGHSSKTSLLYGPYAGATLRYDFTKCWGVYIGARFQSLNDMEQSVGPQVARFNPGATITASSGVTWSF